MGTKKHNEGRNEQSKADQDANRESAKHEIRLEVEAVTR